jgi:hypothetical protein
MEDHGNTVVIIFLVFIAVVSFLVLLFFGDFLSQAITNLTMKMLE